MAFSSWSLSMVSLSKACHQVFFAIACVLFFSLYRAWRQKLPVNWPIIGMLPSIIANYHDLHDYCLNFIAASNWTSRLTGPWFLGMDMVLTSDPANVNHMFITHASSFPKGDEYLEIFDIFGGALIGSNDGESCRTQRKLVHSLLSNQSFRSYELKACRDKVEKVLLPLLLCSAEKNKAIDLQDLFERLTFDISSALFLGVDPGSLSDHSVPFAKAMKDIEEVIAFRHIVPKFWWKTLRWLKLSQEKKMAEAHKAVDQFARDAIARRKESLSKGDGEQQQDDVLTVYLQLPAEQRKNLPEFDKYIKDNALNLLLASSDTTAAALSWFIWLISSHPDVEQKILKELKENWQMTEAVTLDRDRLGKLVYLHAAISETLRLYPPASLQHKQVTTTGTLPSGEKVKPGDVVIVYLFSMARMEELWGKDCREFKPERWITDCGEIKNEPAYKFFSFGSGPRMCLGRELAFTKLKTVISALLRSFLFEVVEGQVVKPKLSVISCMKNGLMVQVSKRERNW